MTGTIETHSAKIRITDIREETLAAVERDTLLPQVASSDSGLSILDILLARFRSANTIAEEQNLLREIGRAAESLDELSEAYVREQVVEILSDHGRSAPARIADKALARLSTTGAKSAPPIVDTVAAWESPVDGADVLTELSAAYTRYAVLPAGATDALALWCMHTYLFDRYMITPRLVLTSPEKRCGKTTVLDLLGATCQRPLPAANLTVAVTFRSIAAAHPTLLIDEADTFLRDEASELRGILNAGHRRGGRVLRCTGDAYEPCAFDVFAPAVIAAIGRIPETLMDRAIVISMRRRLREEQVARFRADRLQPLHELARKCARWADDHRPFLDLDPTMPNALHDRAADNWRPLVAIADRAGGQWPQLGRTAALSLAAIGQDDGSFRIVLLGDIRTICSARREPRIATAALLAELVAMEDRSWGDWSSGQPMTPQALSRLLRGFGVTAAKWREGTTTVRGYERDTFADAWKRYL
jgi:hypothetical protein